MVLDRRVQVEAAERDRLPAHDAAHRHDRHLGATAADVDDQVADRLVDRQVRPDRGRERLLDERHLRPPANRTASSTARFSTSELAEGTQTRTRGRGKRETPTRRRTTSIMRWVMSFLPTASVSLTSQITVPEDRLILLGIVLVATVVLAAVNTRTMFGLATAAVAENRRVAALSGWSTTTIELVNFISWLDPIEAQLIWRIAN